MPAYLRAADAADSAAADTAEFNRDLLPSGGRAQDLSRFERGNVVLPGQYSVDIYVNKAWVGRAMVRFTVPPGASSATPCIDQALLDRLGLDLPGVPASVRHRLAQPGACVRFAELLPNGQASFDQSRLRLDLSVPQADMVSVPRGYVAPQFWNEGIDAGLLNYNFSAFRADRAGTIQTQAYLGLGAGLNLGAWRFRYDGSLSWLSTIGRRWQKVRAYAQRDVPSLGAQFTVGDVYTPGRVFDSVPLRGVEISTDERMLPQSQRGYAPVVRGVARSNARVSVRQNGVLIYQTAVAPGPFVISDLYPTSYGGDLKVTVTEADGSEQHFDVPYASVPQLLRPGAHRFSLAAGRLRDTTLRQQPAVAQGSYMRGFRHGLTGYAGFSLGWGYRAALAGAALNTRVGALALDVTGSALYVPARPSQHGHSVRFSYSKLFAPTSTYIAVAAYRYGSRGYLGLADAERVRDTLLHGGTDTVLRRRSRLDLSLNQPIADGLGSIYLTGSRLAYWNRSGHDTQFQLGYRGSVGNVSFSVSAARLRDALGRTDNQIYASLSVPLGGPETIANLTASMTHDSIGGQQGQATLTGAAGDRQQYTYGATLTRDGGTSGSVNGGYRAGYGLLNAGYASGPGYSQANVGAAGSVLVHSGGVTYGQTTGGTVGLVHAQHAAGARVSSGEGVRVDRNGYAIVPFLTPFARNTVQLDPSGLPVDVQLAANRQSVVPTAGAVVSVPFRTSLERTEIFRARLADGRPLPFGAAVTDAGGRDVGVVAQGGQIFARGIAPRGRLTVSWGDQGSDRCTFDYALPSASRTDRHHYHYEDVTCGPDRGAAGHGQHMQMKGAQP